MMIVYVYLPIDISGGFFYMLALLLDLQRTELALRLFKELPSPLLLKPTREDRGTIRQLVLQLYRVGKNNENLRQESLKVVKVCFSDPTKIYPYPVVSNE